MKISALALTGLLLAGLAYGHEEDEHKPAISGEAKAALVSPTSLQTIQDSYKLSVAPIFEGKCFDCHSDKSRFPWYYRIPGIKQWIDNDIAEGREHMDMSKGFPFTSRHEIDHDLEDLGEEVGEGEMPPKPYVFMHGNAKLTEEDKKTVLAWIESSRTLLKSEKK